MKKKKSSSFSRRKDLVKPMPETFNVKLRSYSRDIVALGTTYSAKAGMLEPLGRDVGYLTQLMAMYTHGRVVASRITWKIVNTSNDPVELLIGPYPDNRAISPADFATRRHTQYSLISAKGGIDNKSGSIRLTSKDVLGKEYMLADFDFNVEQAQNNLPIAEDEPVWAVYLRSLGSALGLVITLEVDYELQLFNLQPADLS